MVADRLHVGALTGVTASCGFFRTAASPLMGAERPADAPSVRGWRSLPAHADEPSSGITLLAVDVEMIERVCDGARLPVKASLVSAVLGPDASYTMETVLDVLVDPSAVDSSWVDPASSANWDFKERITGLGAEFLRSRVGSSTPLADVQTAIAKQLEAGAFLVGHNLASDLRALHLYGPGLRRRLIDTEALYPYDNQRRAPLRALVRQLLVGDESQAEFDDCKSSWDGFQAEGKVRRVSVFWDKRSVIDFGRSLIIGAHSARGCARSSRYRLAGVTIIMHTTGSLAVSVGWSAVCDA